MSFRERYGPWALVVGASEGLGAAFAENAAMRGLDVILLARRRAALDHTAETIEKRHGIRVRTIAADAGQPDFPDRVAEGRYARKAVREYEMLALTAAERWEAFRRDGGPLESRISQRHLASYLGITPEHLSRIRGASVRRRRKASSA